MSGKIEMVGDFAQGEMAVITIVDTSGSMTGEKIGQVNDGMRNAIEYLKEFNENSIDVAVKLACLTFSSGADWVNKKKPLEDPENFVWHDIHAGGYTDFGRACTELKDVLTVEEKGGWMKSRGGIAPVLILMSDGQPTDEYHKQLADLKKRGWFKGALKTAIAIGNDADRNMLKEFTGHEEAIFDVHAFDDLSKVIRKLVVTASMVQSQTTSMSSEQGDSGFGLDIEKAQEEQVKQLKESVEASLDDADLADDF
ncbi:MAG: VWA domain-containing protein [Acholeplasmataceae bacterium]|nr:VWA domain-containing protein [Acholeplasmataceae bacterium]